MEGQAAPGVQERIGNALVEGAFINREQLISAEEISRNTGKRLGEVLIERGLISPETLATVLSFLFNVPVVELRQLPVQPEALHLIPEDIAREHNILPLAAEGNTLRVAMEDPQDKELIKTISALTQMRIRPILPLRGLKWLIESNYRGTTEPAEEMVELATASSEQSEPEMVKMKQLRSEFLFTLAHELKTPLTSLKSSAALLVEEVEGLDNSSLRRLAKLIEKSAERMDGITSKLLYMARLEDAEQEISSKPYNVAELIQAEVEQMIPPVENKGQHIEIEALPSGVMSTMPSERFKEIMDNLLSNAHRYTPEGGRISVSLTKEKNKFTVEVSDTGIGIPKEEQERIFDILYRSKGARMQGIDGSGLGLSIAKRVVEMYGGKIWVSSTAGKGSTFSFSLPMMAD